MSREREARGAPADDDCEEGRAREITAGLHWSLSLIQQDIGRGWCTTYNIMFCLAWCHLHYVGVLDKRRRQIHIECVHFVACAPFACFLKKNLIYIICCILSLLLHYDYNALCLNHISNLHPSHPAAPPLDAMAQAISVGDTHDTEGRADKNLTVCLSSPYFCPYILIFCAS